MRPEAAEIPVVDETYLVERGESSSPSLSADGKYLVFVSGKRPSHVSREVYIRDMDTKLERRITFQNGSTATPRFIDNNAIIYGSSTDEDKESFDLMNARGRPKVSKFPDPYRATNDVYLHRLSGDFSIERVSNHPGYDGEARLQPDGKMLTWTRVEREHTQVMSKPWPKGVAKVLNGLGINPTDYVVAGNGHAEAWINWDDSFGVAKLRLRRGLDTIEIAGDMIVRKSDVAFSPDSRYLLWTQKEANGGENGIWSFELRTNCLQHFIFPRDGDRSQPIVTPDMKWLIYTVVRHAHSNIGQIAFIQRGGNCPIIP